MGASQQTAILLSAQSVSCAAYLHAVALPATALSKPLKPKADLEESSPRRRITALQLGYRRARQRYSVWARVRRAQGTWQKTARPDARCQDELEPQSHRRITIKRNRL